ncbi:biotin/lipoyl-binding protein, partial [Enterobacter hormaechei]|nr:biotin/lipoyl-binding protein [Enterobacter hormaechei]
MTAIILSAILGSYYYQGKSDKTLTLYGNVDIRTVNLSFRVGGKLASLQVDEGDTIAANQVIGQLDNGPFTNALNKAKATRDSTKARLAMMEEGYRTEEIAQVRSEVAQREAAWHFANSFFKRQQGLWQSKVISANELDDAKTN